MSLISIRDYVKNLLAGREQIYKIYQTLDKIHNNRLLLFCYQAKFNGLERKVYNNKQLTELERLADCTPFATLMMQARDNLTTDLYIMLLIKAKPEILKLYQARTKAQFIYSNTKLFCYLFKNPFGSLAGVTQPCLQFKNAQTFCNFYNCSIKCPFNALLVFNGLQINQ